ncbi:unnamed protein product [Brassica napus]|uniref:(rape) hypothetical protein n=1 Tax=Brassica napus TaxID=3708 RepID=A0A816Z6A0_BRANA|nr:unnamed protein product [Brassica napus]
MCLFSKEIRSPCSSFTSSRLHRNLDDSVTSRSRVVCQEVLKMIFISSIIELQIYGLKLVSLRTHLMYGSTQSVGELTDLFGFLLSPPFLVLPPPPLLLSLWMLNLQDLVGSPPPHLHLPRLKRLHHRGSIAFLT